MALLLALLLTACSGGSTSAPVPVEPAPCPTFADAVTLGAVESASIVEASGIAASRRHAGVLWVHNDSGDGPRIFALGEDGRHLGTFALTGAGAQDWEDIAVGPGPVAGRSYIYFGGYVTVYRVPEPEVDPQADAVDGALSEVERLELVYPEGSRAPA